MSHLVACARCGVHVQAAEACPFCARRRTGRVIASVLGLGLVACSGAPVAGPGPEAPHAADAGAPESAAPESAAPETAAPESSAPESAPAPPVALYGMPPQ